MHSPRRLRAFYTGIAPFYNVVVPPLSSTARTLGRRWLQINDGEHLLDLGTGTGLALIDLVAANPSGWTEGLDATPAMLAQTRRRLARCEHQRYGLRLGTATALPYPDDAFDAVFSSYTIDVLPTPQIRPTLREVHRVLRPTGRLVLVYMSPPVHPVERLWANVARFWPLLLGGDRPIDLHPSLSDTDFSIQAHTTRTQLGLRSAIVRAAPA